MLEEGKFRIKIRDTEGKVNPVMLQCISSPRSQGKQDILTDYPAFSNYFKNSGNILPLSKTGLKLCVVPLS